MTESELQSVIGGLKSSLGNFSDSLDLINQRARDMASGAKSSQEVFDENLKKMGKWNKTTDELHKKHLQQQFDELQKAKELATKLDKEKEKVKNALDKLEDDIHKSSAALHKAFADEAAGVVGATAARKKAQADLLRERTAKQAYNKQMMDLTAEQTKAVGAQSNIVGAMRKTERELSSFSWKDAGKQVGSKMGDAVKSGIKGVMSGLTVTNAVSGLYSGMSQIMATSGDNLFASLEQQVDLIKLGLTPQEYIEMNAASRQTILASGGVAKQMEILKYQSKDLEGHFATVGDRTKYVQGQMNALVKAGVRPTAESAGLLNNQMKRLKAITGMTGDQFTQLTSEMVEDGDIQMQLRMANESEREQVVATTMARIAEFQAIGMNTEQAKKATKAMAAIGNMKTIDRFKRAAKLQVMAGALGIEGGERAAQATRMGKNAPQEEQDHLARVEGKISEKFASMKGSQDYGVQILADVMQEKLGNSNTEILSVFNTSLAKANEIQDEALKYQKQVPDLLKKAIEMWQIGSTAKSYPAVQAAGGAAGGLWNMLGPGAMGAVGGWAGAKFLGKALPSVIPSTAGPTAGPATGAAGRAAGFLKGAGGKALGAAGAVGVSGYEAYDAYSEHAAGKISDKERNAKYGSAGGGLAGALAGAKAGAAGGGALGALFGGVGAAPGALIGGLAGGALGYWGGSAAGGALGGSIGDDEAKRRELIEETKAKAKAKVGLSPSDQGTQILSDKFQEKLVDPKAPPPSPLTSADTRADVASPIGMQLAKMEQSNNYLNEVVKLNTKQVELAEKQLAATIVSNEDKGELYKSLSSGNKFMTTYKTLQ